MNKRVQFVIWYILFLPLEYNISITDISEGGTQCPLDQMKDLANLGNVFSKVTSM